MAKKLTWHMSPREAGVTTSAPKIRLVWLRDGVLARLVSVDQVPGSKGGWGRKAKVKIRTIGIVTVVKVHSSAPGGFSDILHGTGLMTVSNSQLRPMEE